MRDELAEPVYQILKKGFALIDERRARGESVDIDQARNDLLALLNDPRLTEAGQDKSDARFALVCWLDEMLIDPSRPTPWGQEWSRRSLENHLYRSRERFHLFWDPGVRQAEARSSIDTLEVYYLCMLLGFRGDFGDRPEELRAGPARVQTLVLRGFAAEPPQRDDSAPPNNVPLLDGEERLQTMLKVWGVVLLLLALGLGFWVVYTTTRP
jgi:type VI secretion system protein ImpK